MPPWTAPPPPDNNSVTAKSGDRPKFARMSQPNMQAGRIDSSSADRAELPDGDRGHTKRDDAGRRVPYHQLKFSNVRKLGVVRPPR